MDPGLARRLGVHRAHRAGPVVIDLLPALIASPVAYLLVFRGGLAGLHHFVAR